MGKPKKSKAYVEVTEESASEPLAKTMQRTQAPVAKAPAARAAAPTVPAPSMAAAPTVTAPAPTAPPTAVPALALAPTAPVAISNSLVTNLEQWLEKELWVTEVAYQGAQTRLGMFKASVSSLVHKLNIIIRRASTRLTAEEANATSQLEHVEDKIAKLEAKMK